MKKQKYLLIIGYVLLLHFLASFIVLKLGMIGQAKHLLGLIDEEITPHYIAMSAFYQRMESNIPPQSILFFGDDFIQRLAVNTINDGALNFGIGTETSRGLLLRIKDNQAIESASLMAIMIGKNDFTYRHEAEIFENIQQIIKHIPAHTPILITGLLPIDRRYFSPEQQTNFATLTNKRIQSLNSQIKNWSDSVEQVTYVDLFNHFTDEYGHLAANWHVGDGFHLNADGNQVLITAYKNIIEN
ncbi:GDSL-type esterase/lipase family protein [Aliikangiella maris]|uniref:GDSL-type esterase/lipase family protein n=2 Tax=Aliikangiella maris TaxID=3162458 RepID=A0ABV2BR65_9GAMM